MKHCGIALAVFLLAFVVLRHAQPSGILLYQGLALGAIVTALQVAVVHWSCRTTAESPLKDGLITFLLIYVFVFTVPTTVDRAYSVKMIIHLADAPDGLTREEVAGLYVADFVQNGGVDKRLQEQGATGSIEKLNDRYRLTSAGRWLARSFVWTQRVFACGEPLK